MGKPPRQRGDEEWQADLRRVLRLPELDQLKVLQGISDNLAGGAGPVSKRDLELRARHAACESMQVAAAYLRLPDGVAPSIPEYQRAESQTALPLSFSVVYGAFEKRWKLAERYYRRERVPGTATQRALRRVTLGSARAVHEHPLESLRQFSAQAASDTADDYREWARLHNEQLEPGQTRHQETPEELTRVLRVSWRGALAVARNEVTLADAQREHLDYLLKAAGPLVAATVAGAMLAMKPQHVRHYAAKRSFPRRAGTIDGVRVWRRADIEAYAHGKRDFTGDHDALQDQLVGSSEIAQLVGLPRAQVYTWVHHERWDRVPPPAGNCGRLYWLRPDVDRWLVTRSVSGTPSAPKKRQKPR